MSLFWQSFCLLAFGAACWAVGDFVRKRFLQENLKLSRIARHSLAFSIGNVVFSYLLTALGFIGAFYPKVLWAVFLTGIAIAIWRIFEELRGPTFSILINQTIRKKIDNSSAKEKNEEYVASIILLLVLLLFFLPAILQAAAPPYARDSLVYHLLCPKEYLKAGRLVHIQGNIFSAFPKGHEVLMTLLLSIAGDRAAQGFSILQQIAAIGSLYSLTCLMTGPWPAALCSIGYATVPPVVYFTGCGYVEPALLMTLGGCLLVLVLSIRSERGGGTVGKVGFGSVSLIGFLAGWMPALKYSGLIYLGLIGLILLWNQRKAVPKKALSVIGMFSLSAAPGFCWMGWNWMTLGNPVYPMAWFLFGGRGWDESRAFTMSQYFDLYGMGRNLSDYFVLPWRLAFEGRFDTIFFDGAIGPFLILAIVMAAASTVFLARRRWVGAKLGEIGLMFIVSAAFFVFGTQQVRFWLPSQMLACTFAAPSVGFLVDWARRKRSIKVVLFFVLIVSLGWNMWFLGKQFLKIGFYRPVLGIEQEKDFLIRKVPGYPALEFINQNLPTRAYLFCIWTGAYGYYLDRRYYSDTFVEDSTLKEFIHASADGKELSQRVTQAGFSHLFLNVFLLEKNVEQSGQAILGSFLREGTRELFRDQNFRVLETRQPSQQ
jgi:hypothetical protein